LGIITVTDTLPAGLTFNAASGTGWACGTAGQTVTCTNSTVIAAGANATVLTLTVNVLAAAVPGVTNSASASGGGSANAPVATDPTTVAGPVLVISKTHAGAFAIGATGTYTIDVSNTGASPTYGTITVHDTLPAGLTFNTATGTSWTCAASGQTVTCTSVAAIAAGATGNPIALTVHVTGGSGSVVNSVDANGGGAANTPSTTDPTNISGAPVLTLVKSHSGSFVVGEIGTYTLVAGNTGSVATSGLITVSDALPAGLTFEAASGNGWACSATGPAVTCTTASSIAPGSSAAPISLRVNVLAGAMPSVTNSASSSGGGAANTPTATDSTAVNGAAVIAGLHGLAIEKLVDDVRSVSTKPGASVTYTFGFINAGNVDATDVTLTDPFPDGTTPVLSSVTLNGSAAGSAATLAGQTLKVSIPVLHPNSPQTISVRATVSGARTSGQTYVNVGVIQARGIAPVQTTPASVFDGTTNIVYDGTKGGDAPIAGATIALVDPSTGKPIPLARVRAPEVASTDNPQTTGANGSFGFALTPAQFGKPGEGETYRLTLSAHNFRNRSIQAAFDADASGLLYTVTLTALDDQPLAIEGGFATVTRSTTIANVSDLINNIPMFPAGALEVQKQADRTTVSVGDRVVYTVTIVASQPFGETRIVDQLPAGLAYAPHSGTVDGAALEPQVSGLTQIWQLPELATGTHVLRYAVVVGAGTSQNAKLTNVVDVTASVPGGAPARASAQASLETIAGAFSDRLTILGRVVIGSADGGWTSVSRGVPGVRVLMEDGTTVVTDAQGRYSFQEVRPGAHVLRLDTSSLPAGVSAFDSHAYNDPRSTVRLVHTLMDTRLIQDVIFVVQGQ